MGGWGWRRRRWSVGPWGRRWRAKRRRGVGWRQRHRRQLRWRGRRHWWPGRRRWRRQRPALERVGCLFAVACRRVILAHVVPAGLGNHVGDGAGKLVALKVVAATHNIPHMSNRCRWVGPCGGGVWTGGLWAAAEEQGYAHQKPPISRSGTLRPSPQGGGGGGDIHELGHSQSSSLWQTPSTFRRHMANGRPMRCMQANCHAMYGRVGWVRRVGPHRTNAVRRSAEARARLNGNSGERTSMSSQHCASTHGSNDLEQSRGAAGGGVGDGGGSRVVNPWGCGSGRW